MEKGSIRSTATMQEILYRRKDCTSNTTLLGVRVLFWKLACSQAYWAKVQRWYHARIRTKALLHNFIIPDSTAGIVAKLNEAMAKWKQYIKSEA
jgi:hypothetical protein